MYILFRCRIVRATVGPLFHGFKVSLVVIDAPVVGFLLDDKQLTLTAPEWPYSDSTVEQFLWVHLPFFRPCLLHFN